MVKTRKRRGRRRGSRQSASTHAAVGGVAAGGSAAAVLHALAARLPESPALVPFLSDARRWLSPLLALTALLLMTTVTYWPVFAADYIWDDKIFLEEAPSIQAALGVLDIWFDPRTIKNEAHYWPLVYSSFWLEYQLWGFNPLASHAVNLLLHSVICVLLWSLLARLAVPGAWLIAALFALHPVHVEAVAWVMARKDLFATLFYLLAAGAWLRFRHHTGSGGDSRQRRRAYLWLLSFFVAGMMSKSLIITLPAVLLLCCWWQQGRVQQRDLQHTLPLFIIGFLILLGDLSYYQRWAVIDFTYSWAERPIIAAKALWFYVGKLLWPVPLLPIYPKWDVNPAVLLNWLPLLAGVVLLLGLYFLRHRFGRGPLVAALLFAVILSPMLGLGINVFMLFSFAADRYQYLASAALLALLVAAAVTGLAALCRRIPAAAIPLRAGACVLSLVVLVGYGTMSHGQILRAYQHDAAFWQWIVDNHPQAHSGYYNLGLALVDRGEVQAGIDAYHRALNIDPADVEAHLKYMDESYQETDTGTFINLSFALLELENFEHAVLAARRATQLDPEAMLGHQNLASGLHRLERYEEALAALQEVTRLMKPPSAEQYYFQGHLALLLERREEAEGYLLRSLEIDPGYADARNQMRDLLLEDATDTGNYAELLAFDPRAVEFLVRRAAALTEAGETEQAVQAYQQALAIEPNHSLAMAQAAFLLYNELQRYREALDLFRRIVDSDPTVAQSHANLGSALAQTGNYAEAIASFERALIIDPQLESARTNMEMAQSMLSGASVP